MGGATSNTGDYLLLDADGAVVIARARVDEVLQASAARERREAANRERFASGVLSIDLVDRPLRAARGARLPPHTVTTCR